MKLGEAMYKEQADAEGGPDAASGEADDDGVIDADFEEIDGNKK